ncbi:MAG: hypothetical protein LBC18_03010, partial [Opitutaceae bacterium]|nr:hypothetical protein [Opitutaceae bacterium]
MTTKKSIPMNIERNMRASIGALACLLLLGMAAGRASQAGGPVRPLADDFVVVGESDDPKNTPLYSPSILRLDSG